MLAPGEVMMTCLTASEVVLVEAPQPDVAMAGGARCQRCGDYDSRSESCVRDLTPSLRNALRM
jgi:hypothetical protein